MEKESLRTYLLLISPGHTPTFLVLVRMEVRGRTGDFGEAVEGRFPFNVCVVLPLSMASFKSQLSMGTHV